MTKDARAKCQQHHIDSKILDPISVAAEFSFVRRAFPGTNMGQNELRTDLDPR